MKELGEGTRDVIVSTCGWDINPRALGIVPKEAEVFALEGTHWIPDTQFMCIPKGVPEDKVAVLLALMSYMLKPEQQAVTYDKGYFYPGPAVKGVTLAMAPQESRDVLKEFGRPNYDELIAKLPTEAAADAGTTRRRLPALGPGDRRRQSAKVGHALRRHRPRPSPYLPHGRGLLDAGATCAGFDPQTSDPRVLAGLPRALSRAHARRDGRAAARRLRRSTSSSVGGDSLRPRRASPSVPCGRQGCHGRQAGRDEPSTSSPQVEASGRARPGASSRSASPSASSCHRRSSPESSSPTARSAAWCRRSASGPHRLNRAIRPSWFFDTSAYGGILIDIASHQIDQFLHFTGSTDAEIVASSIGHFGAGGPARFRGFRRDPAAQRRRPAAISASTGSPPTACRPGATGGSSILGTEGTIELRKYVDIDGRPGTDHLFLVDRSRHAPYRCLARAADLFPQLLIADVARPDAKPP